MVWTAFSDAGPDVGTAVVPVHVYFVCVCVCVCVSVCVCERRAFCKSMISGLAHFASALDSHLHVRHRSYVRSDVWRVN